jgi:hypothetical protein
VADFYNCYFLGENQTIKFEGVAFMGYKLRFVQHFRQDKADEFIKLEKKFMELEKNNSLFPKGKRFTPYFGREALNTLIWESDFETLEEAVKANQFLKENILHKELYDQQVKYFINSYTEIYKKLED